MRRGAATVIFEIDSPGGTVSASCDLAERIDALEVRSVILVFEKACGGAALAAHAGDEIVMGWEAEIGDGRERMGVRLSQVARSRFREGLDPGAR